MKEKLDALIELVDRVRDDLHTLRQAMPDLISGGDLGEAERYVLHASKHLHAKQGDTSAAPQGITILPNGWAEVTQ